MPQGALSRHLFHWKNLKLKPLYWKTRLNIALDVARGMEYLHTLAHHSFIHRDLKSSNILLGDDFRAKVSDFGLVKLVPDGGKSIMTRVDVFSYGVILMELLTGLMVLDNDGREEKRYLVEWFSSIRADKEKVMAAVDFSLNANDEIFETISVVAELAGHCTAREPSQRPDIGHAVNVLAPLVEKWKPMESEADVSCGGVDYSLPLTQMVKRWQEVEAEGKDYVSYMDLDDGKSIIPAGSTNSFTSVDDGR
ncbi:putative protein kinase RLK-Pelle-LRR-IX family [Helianthus debilis subsp. tardiflorus]